MRSYRLYFHHLNGSGYNIQFWLYPRPLKSRKYKTTVWKSSILCRWSWCIEQLPPSRPIRSATASTFSTFKNPLKTHTMLSNLTSSVMTSLCCCAFVVLLVLLLLLLLLLSSAKLCHIDFQDSGRYVAIFLPVSDWVSHFLEKLNVYQHTKFRQENSVHGWDITICKMAAAAAQYYFRFPVYCCQCVHTVKIYQQTKFCRPISIHSFKSKRPPYWNTTSGFDFYYITVIGMLFCTRLPNFIQNRASYCGNMT